MSARQTRRFLTTYFEILSDWLDRSFVFGGFAVDEADLKDYGIRNTAAYVEGG